MMLRAVLLASVVVASAGISVITSPPSVASACSCPDCDPVRDAWIIVGGRIGKWQRISIERPPETSSLAPISVEFTVEHVYKGSAPASLTLIDLASLDTYSSDDNPRWAGGSGACGSFDWDPTGQYFIAAISPSNHVPGAYGVGRIGTFYIGDEPKGEWYERALARLAPLGLPSPPNAGNTIAPTPTPATALGWALITCSIGLTAAAIARRR